MSEIKALDFTWTEDMTAAGYHIPKLTLLEVWPLFPFIGGKRDLVVLDIGANMGLWCQAWMNTFGALTKEYYAFEPLSGNFDILRRRVGNHVLRQERVKAFMCCVGAEEGDITIHTHAEISTTASILLEKIKVGEKLVDNNIKKLVPQITIDAFVERNLIQRVDLIKIDVEGYEWSVLQGARDSIDRGIVDMIYFEFGQHQGELGQSFHQFWEFFTQRGFILYKNAHIRNFFGLQKLSRYHESLEDNGSISMVLASRRPHDPALNRPFVIGNYAY